MKEAEALRLDYDLRTPAQLKQDVAKDFEEIITRTAMNFVASVQDKVKCNLLMKFSNDPDLTSSTRLMSLQEDISVDITDVVTDMFASTRPEVHNEVFSTLGKLGYLVQSVDTRTSSLTRPGLSSVQADVPRDHHKLEYFVTV